MKYRQFQEPTRDEVQRLHEDGQVFLSSVYTEDGKGIRGMVRVWLWESPHAMYDDCYCVQGWGSTRGNTKAQTFYFWSAAVVEAWRKELDSLLDAEAV